MNETAEKKKTDPWQLIAILMVVLVVLAGLFMLNQAINTRADNIEKAIATNGEIMKMNIMNVSEQLSAMRVAAVEAQKAQQQAAQEAAAAEAAAAAAAAAAEEAPKK